jgi:hypothetical protein
VEGGEGEVGAAAFAAESSKGSQSHPRIRQEYIPRLSTVYGSRLRLLCCKLGNTEQPRAAATLALSPVAGARVKGGSIAARSFLRLA